MSKYTSTNTEKRYKHRQIKKNTQKDKQNHRHKGTTSSTGCIAIEYVA